jgi:hypothetical protein
VVPSPSPGNRLRDADLGHAPEAGPVTAAAGPQPPPLHPGLPAPELEAAYQASQADPNLSDEEKIKVAIQTYFDLKAQSLVLGESLDLGFVIDRSTEAGTDLYNYELGLLQYNLAGWRYGGTPSTECVYTWTYESIETADMEGEVILRLSGEYRDPGDPQVSRFGNEPHAASVVRHRSRRRPAGSQSGCGSSAAEWF